MLVNSLSFLILIISLNNLKVIVNLILNLNSILIFKSKINCLKFKIIEKFNIKLIRTLIFI